MSSTPKINRESLARAYEIALARATPSDGGERKFGTVAEVLRMRLEGKSLKEIAAHLDIETNRVSQIIGRAIRYRGYAHERDADE